MKKVKPDVEDKKQKNFLKYTEKEKKNKKNRKIPHGSRYNGWYTGMLHSYNVLRKRRAKNKMARRSRRINRLRMS